MITLGLPQRSRVNFLLKILKLITVALSLLPDKATLIGALRLISEAKQGWAWLYLDGKQEHGMVWVHFRAYI